MTHKHEMQHPTGPTWCIWCGVFSCYCRDGDVCAADQSGKPPYDFSQAKNRARQLTAMLGDSGETQAVAESAP